MAFEHKPNSGTLFKNDRRAADSQPNAKGEALIGGVAYWVSAWTKKDKNGNPWQSLSFTPKGGAPNQPTRQAVPATHDDVPF